MRAEEFAVSGALPDGAGCIARLQSLRQELTPGQRQLVDTVLKDPHSVILASVGELAQRAGTSEAAVSRFARAVGFTSYAEFKLALSRDLVDVTQSIHEDVEHDDAIGTLAVKIASANARAIQDTVRALDADTLDRATEVIAAASRVAFFGFGGSAAVARDAWHHFLRTGKTVVTIDDSHEQVMWATNTVQGDAIILFSHTGTSRDLCDVAEIAAEQGAVTISITNLGRSPLTRRATLNLFTSSRETRYREESMSSRIAAMTVVDILYVAVALGLAEEMADRRDRIRRAIQRKRF